MAERMSGWRNRIPSSTVMRPSASAASAASTEMPRRLAAARSHSGLPAGSAAARSNSSSVWRGSALNRLQKLLSRA